MIRIHIDRLVVEGPEFGPGGHERLRAAVEEHLAEVLDNGAPGWRPTSGATDRVTGVDVSLVAGDARRSGHRIADSVASSLTGAPPPGSTAVGNPPGARSR